LAVIGLCLLQQSPAWANHLPASASASHHPDARREGHLSGPAQPGRNLTRPTLRWLVVLGLVPTLITTGVFLERGFKIPSSGPMYPFEFPGIEYEGLRQRELRELERRVNEAERKEKQAQENSATLERQIRELRKKLDEGARPDAGTREKTSRIEPRKAERLTRFAASPTSNRKWTRGVTNRSADRVSTSMRARTNRSAPQLGRRGR
jgi:hypothetical protein